MNNNPTISVLMTVYNDEKYLAQAMESILGQTYTNFEFIIVNGGSTDNSPQILEEYRSKDSRIRLIHQENRGIAPAINDAFALSRGKYIARMDGDDISMPERFAKQLQYLEENPIVDILGCQVNVMDEYGNIGKVVQSPLSHNTIKIYVRHRLTPLCQSAVFLKREVMSALNGYRNFLAMEDYDFLLRAIECGYILTNLNDALVNYRMNSLGISMTNTKQQEMNIRRAYSLYRQRLRGRTESTRILQKLYSRHSITSNVYKLCRKCIMKMVSTEDRVLKIALLIVIIFICIFDINLITRYYHFIYSRLIVKQELKALQRKNSCISIGQ